MRSCRSWFWLFLLIIALSISDIHGQSEVTFNLGHSDHHQRVDVNEESQCTDYFLSSLSDRLQILALQTESSTFCRILVSTNSSYVLSFKFQDLDDRDISCEGSIKIYQGDRFGGKPTYEYSCLDELPLKDVTIYYSKLTLIFESKENGFENIGLLVSSSPEFYFSTLSGVLALCLGGSAILATIVVLIMKCCGCFKSADRRADRERLISRLRDEGYNVTRNYGSTEQRVGPVPYSRLPNEDLTWGKMVFQPVVSQAQNTSGASCSHDTPPPNYDTLSNQRVTIQASEQSAFSQVQQTEQSQHQPVTGSSPGPSSVAQPFHSTVSHGISNSTFLTSAQPNEHSMNTNQSMTHVGCGSVGFTPSTQSNSDYRREPTPPPTFGSVD